MFDAILYIGKGNHDRNEPLPFKYVRELTEAIHGTGRNVTMDNWFTSVPLAKEMVSRYNITIVETLRKNTPELPDSFQSSRGKEVGSSQFAFDKETLLVSHCPKRVKAFFSFRLCTRGRTSMKKLGNLRSFTSTMRRKEVWVYIIRWLTPIQFRE